MGTELVTIQRNILRTVLLVAATFAASCTTMEEPLKQDVASLLAATSTDAELVGDAPASASAANTDNAGDQQAATGPAKAKLYKGTDKLVRMPKAAEPTIFIGEKISLNFEQAPLSDVVHAILGEILELNYFVQTPIAGEVTLRTRMPVEQDQVFEILESLLEANGGMIVRDENGRFFVSGSGSASKFQSRVSASASDALGFSTVIFPLQYISASGMAEILTPVAEPDAFVRIDDARNLLMLAGTGSQLRGWQEMIDTFDVDMLAGMSVGIFPIENGSIEEVETALATLLGGSSTGDQAGGGLAGAGSLIRVVPIPRLSSILIVTPRAHYLTLVEKWIKRLDQVPDANYERRLYVYRVQNSNAEHLASLLSTIYGGGSTSGSSGSTQRDSGVAPGMTPERVTDSGDSTGQIGSSISGSSRSSSSRGPNGPSNYSVGDVRVVADEDNNALLIYATGKEYRKIEPALERLDVAATQVIIEASIVEVTLDESLEYGLEWSFNGGLDDGFSGVGNLFGSTPTPLSNGFAYSVLNSSGSVKAVLNALAERNLLNVISSPSVMVLDNQTATIQVGNQVAVRGNSTVNADGFLTESFSYRDTGVQLEVTPSVNAGGMVTMDIDQAVTDVNESSGTVNEQPTFLERKITSRVAVRSSESIVLGGLILENQSNDSSGLPLLHDLPVVGALFGKKKKASVRTELLVIITPRAIYSDSELRAVSQEMRSQMRGLELIDVDSTSAFLANPKLKVNAEPIK
ncbi:MAG: type II secretion system secretin GspD [Halioglobus sp.]